MAHFYGTLQGARGEATRLGTKNSGLMTTTCSYEGKVRMTLTYDPELGCDIARVELARHMGSGTERLLYEGPVGEFDPTTCVDCNEGYKLDVLPNGIKRCPGCKTEHEL